MSTALWKRVVARILEALLALIFIIPLAWVVVSSFSPQAGSAQSQGWGVANYLTLFGYQDGLPTYLVNSIIVTVIAVFFSVLVCTLAGYSFSRFNYPGRNLGFMVTLSILMVPYASLLIPLMVWFKDIGLNNSLLGVALVITLFQLPMSTFIMRIAFDAIPKDMEEAAMVDGCNSFQALMKILVPVVKPSMVTVGLLAFLEAWNNFMIPLYLVGSGKATLPLALVNMRQQTMGVIDYGATEAGVVILLIPAAILFLALQKYYVKGFMAGAVKG
ncbi:carbohydrate ABC transporter permease [Bifidobacterium sp. ESL0704]|uniref:carbohydrate ABC transporter permease n=1 Tax=Bifidobacterium sp. ESL0704 TaxID=2983219 RepID=UPI0023F68EBD|nr:carbohydrate ABC transporter permease [Bifidobacterium sp. ESL0704]WEV53188.1 carbohydrate ABC transporter permease [Bifidobacterium sp. ESL0704]